MPRDRASTTQGWQCSHCQETVYMLTDALCGPCWQDRARRKSSTNKPTTGLKYDTGKQRYDLLPTHALSALVDVLTFGAAKYKPNSWQLVENGKARYFAASMRHLWAYWRGEEYDEESGIHHLAHAACCVMFMLDLELQHKQANSDGPTDQQEEEQGNKRPVYMGPSEIYIDEQGNTE